MTIIIDPESLTTMYSTSTSLSDGDNDIDDTLSNVAVTATSLTTSLSTASNSKTYAEETRSYVDSLSNEELYKFEQMLSEKEQEMLFKTEENIAFQKVKI